MVPAGRNHRRKEEEEATGLAVRAPRGQSQRGGARERAKQAPTEAARGEEERGKPGGAAPPVWSPSNEMLQAPRSHLPEEPPEEDMQDAYVNPMH